MPEGPEIHRAADNLRKALEGQIITHVECPYTTIRGQEHRFLGQEVISVKARSKAMLIHIGDDILYSHNQLYGRCLLYTSPSPRDATLSRMPSSA